MDQYQESLGQYLKRRREARQLSVQEMALSAGVKTPFVEAIEENNFSVFANYSQIVWLVKQYSKFLKLNQADALRRFEVQWDLYTDFKRFPQLSLFEDDDKSCAEPIRVKRKNFFVSFPKTGIRFYIVALILVIVFYLLIFLTTSKPGATPSLIVRFYKSIADSLYNRTHPSRSDAGKTDKSLKESSNSAHNQTLPVLAGNGGGKNPPSAIRQNTVLPKKRMAVIGNRDTKRYHLPGMKYYHEVQQYHRIIFPSEEDAIKAGYHKAGE